MKILPQSCEFCWEKEAGFITYTRKYSWKFCCIDCEEDIELYHICLERLVTEEWVKHLSEKNWFYDTKDEFLKRYCYRKLTKNKGYFNRHLCRPPEIQRRHAKEIFNV